MCCDNIYSQRGNSTHVGRIEKGFPEKLTSEPRPVGQERLGLCHELNCISPPVPTNSYVEVLTPKVMEFRHGPLGGN